MGVPSEIVLRPGLAGRVSGSRIVAEPKTPGFVFTSSIGEQRPGHYRFGLVFDRASFVSALTDRSGYATPSGLMLELVHGAKSLGCRPIALDELARGNVSVEFEIPAGSAKGALQTEVRLFSTGQVGFAISGACVEQMATHTPVLDIAYFNYIPMLTAGPAGMRKPGSSGLGRVIRAERECPGFIAFGPYVWLPKGHYAASFDFNIDPNQRSIALKIEAATHLGDRLLAEESIEIPWRQNLVMRLVGRRRGTLTRHLRFDIRADAPEGENGFLEFRVWTPGKTAFSLVALRVGRVG